MINTLFFVLCLVTSSTGYTIDSTHSTLKEDSELKRQPKVINTKSGYTVDCVDIYKQPAFNHPLLKNHKLQRKPSFESETSANIFHTKLMHMLEKVRCPKETVPIPRTTRDEIIQSSFSFNNHSLAQTSSSSRSAYVFVDASFGPYYGVSGSTSMYNPKVDKGQSSEGYLYVKNGEGDGTNMIVIGWNVSPDLYNDDATHIYLRWTSDNFKTTGCYNMLCNGFVQTDRYFFGSRVGKTSTYDGKMVEMPISLFQDPTTKNWWVKVVNITIGYFPATLFSNLAKAKEVGWGGRTVTPAGASSPSMGSGHLPDDDFKHACYFRYIAYQSVARRDLGPEYYMIGKFNDAPKSCYEVEFYGDQRGQVGYSMQFGGPGGNCGT